MGLKYFLSFEFYTEGIGHQSKEKLKLIKELFFWKSIKIDEWIVEFVSNDDDSPYHHMKMKKDEFLKRECEDAISKNLISEIRVYNQGEDYILVKSFNVDIFDKNDR